jgi:hypothetical protein
MPGLPVRFGTGNMPVAHAPHWQDARGAHTHRRSVDRPLAQGGNGSIDRDKEKPDMAAWVLVGVMLCGQGGQETRGVGWHRLRQCCVAVAAVLNRTGEASGTRATAAQPAAHVATVAAPASDASKADLEARVRRLIRQLDASQLRQRDAAEKELASLGPKVLGLLPAPDDRQSAEVVQRLGRVRQQLQQAEADASVRATRVSLRVDKQPVSKVLAEIT